MRKHIVSEKERRYVEEQRRIHQEYDEYLDQNPGVPDAREYNQCDQYGHYKELENGEKEYLY